MTFRKFAEIAAAHRPDAVVHAHGSFGGVQDIAIYFKRSDGSKSRVYSYRGSYADILNRLGIKVITQTDVATAEAQLRMAKKAHGKPGLFTKGTIRDCSEEIEHLTELLRRYQTDEFVRDWE